VPPQAEVFTAGPFVSLAMAATTITHADTSGVI
jgi:hypothetical protein